MMELLLLSDIDGIGRKNDLVVVGDGYALNHLLPKRKALVATPNVRRRYAEDIKRRAFEKQRETTQKAELVRSVDQKTVSLKRKVTKTGKLYASITEEMIIEALQTQHNVSVPVQAISMPDSIKATGKHRVTVQMNGEVASLTVDIQSE